MFLGQADSFGYAFNAQGNTIAAAVASSSQDFPITQSMQQIVTNIGTVTAFVSFGAASQTTVIPTGTGSSGANGIPVMPGVSVPFTTLNAMHMGAITASGTTTLYVTPGQGE